jgi:hypothetical protein
MVRRHGRVTNILSMVSLDWMVSSAVGVQLVKRSIHRPGGLNEFQGLATDPPSCYAKNDKSPELRTGSS